MILNIINHIKTEFGNTKHFSIKELQKVLEKVYPGTNEKTLKWKIHDLKEKEIIRHVTRGVYSLAEQKGSYFPDISPEAKELYENIHQELPYAKLSISHSGWFNEFMLHQVYRTHLIIEVEKEAAETVFYRLLEQGKKVFLNPGRKIFEYYITNTENPTIVKSLISESPLMELDDIKVTSLEKLLLDCFSDTEIYAAQNSEMSYIFEKATERYKLNIGRLKRYARRRNKTAEITRFINEKK